MRIRCYHKGSMAILGLSILTAIMPAYAEKAPVETRNIVVTATRTEQEVQETPATVQVITQEQIQAQGAATLRQVLEAAASITFDVDGMKGGVLSIRGSASRHVMILIDGKRISGEVSLERGNTFEIDRISMENVERIEIIRGAGSALYGSDAMGGVINVITKKPDKPQWRLEVEGKKADAFSDGRNWLLHYDAGNQGKFGWTASAGERKEDPFIASNGDSNNYYGTRRPFTFQGVWATGKDGKITFGYDFLDEQTERLNGSTWYVNDNQRTDYNIGYQGKAGDTDYQLRAYRSTYDKDYESRNKNTSVLQSFDVIKRRVSVVEANASREWRQNHLLTFGAEYREEFVRGTRIDSGKNKFTLIREGKKSQGAEADLTYYAVYLQDEWVPNDRLLLISALRFDDSDQFESAVSPKLGITYKIKPNSRLKANIGYGFKTPTTTELYHAFQMGNLIYFTGNPDLKPEKSQTCEIGWEGEQGPVFGKLTFFRNEIKDLIETYDTGQTLPGSNIRIHKYDNIGKAQMQGVEAEIGKQINDRLTARVSYTYLEAQNKITDARLDRQARHQIGASLLYADKDQGVSGSLWGTWRGDYLDSNRQEKSYGIWNILVNKELDSKTTLYLGVDNVFDYRDYDRWINGTVYRTGLKLKF